MTDYSTIIIAIIAAFPPTLVALISVFQNIKQAKSIQDVHSVVNSRVEELVRISREKGIVEGKEIARKELLNK